MDPSKPEAGILCMSLEEEGSTIIEIVRTSFGNLPTYNGDCEEEEEEDGKEWV